MKLGLVIIGVIGILYFTYKAGFIGSTNTTDRRTL